MTWARHFCNMQFCQCFLKTAFIHKIHPSHYGECHARAGVYCLCMWIVCHQRGQCRTVFFAGCLACTCTRRMVYPGTRSHTTQGVLLVKHPTLHHPKTSVTGWLEAFAAHPRIGDIDGLRKKFGAFADMSKGEQASAAATATDDILCALQEWNTRYEAKFGHIFIICARGKTAPEMLDAVKSRCVSGGMCFHVLMSSSLIIIVTHTHP